MGRKVIFWSLWSFVLLVSAYDGYLASAYLPDAPHDEQNPWGRLLIALGGVPLLVSVKSFGTTLAMAVLPHVPYRNKVVVGMAILQGLLLAYLMGAFDGR